MSDDYREFEGQVLMGTNLNSKAQQLDRVPQITSQFVDQSFRHCTALSNQNNGEIILPQKTLSINGGCTNQISDGLPNESPESENKENKRVNNVSRPAVNTSLVVHKVP